MHAFRDLAISPLGASLPFYITMNNSDAYNNFLDVVFALLQVLDELIEILDHQVFI
jgi:hypothetical protein